MATTTDSFLQRGWQLAFALLVGYISALAAAAPSVDAAAAAALVADCERDFRKRYPSVGAQARTICESHRDQAIATLPLADALLAMPRRGGNRRIGAVVVRAQGAVPARIELQWSASGEPVPWDLPRALTLRAARVATIACLRMGTSESTTVLRVTPASAAPFTVTVDSRSAAVASQGSWWSARADYAAPPPTLASLRSAGDSWEPNCE